jgi:hypothetical protein
MHGQTPSATGEEMIGTTACFYRAQATNSRDPPEPPGPQVWLGGGRGPFYGRDARKGRSTQRFARLRGADAVSKRFLERVAKNLGPDLGG